MWVKEFNRNPRYANQPACKQIQESSLSQNTKIYDLNLLILLISAPDLRNFDFLNLVSGTQLCLNRFIENGFIPTIYLY